MEQKPKAGELGAFSTIIIDEEAPGPNIAVSAAAAATPPPGYASSDYDTLSPVPLSPYERSTPQATHGFITPRTPASVSASPVSPYINAALQDLIHAGQMLHAKTSDSNNNFSNQEKAQEYKSSRLENFSILAHLATFGVLGVLIRYGLGKLFDEVGHVASIHTALFHDLPANMFGCFFMGWVGCVLKKDISRFSPPLALGLSTGLMGSITTFSSWMVKLVMVMTKGFWLRGLVAILIGLELSFMSLLVGMHTAHWFRAGIIRLLDPKSPSPDDSRRKFWSFLVFLALGLGSWTLFLVLAVLENNNLERRTLWLSCVLSPPGVWLRWILARGNGKGFGSSKKLDWFPWGTLAANLIACVVGYATSIVLLATDSYRSTLWIGAIQMGSLGCLSTVSTFVVEVYNLGKAGSCKPGKAYAYSMVSVVSATLLGIVFYSSIVWAKKYDIVL